MTSGKKLFIFDLDFTLWDAGGTWCDCTTPPYRRILDHVADAHDRMITLYPDVPAVMETLKLEHKLIAIASRTEAPDWAAQILDLFGIRHLFDFEEIFPDRKTVHISNIRKKSGIAYNDMVFFDDEHRNIEDVGKLGVHSNLVTSGLRKDHVFRHL